MRRSPNVGFLLGQCRRWWTNIKPTFGQRFMFTLVFSIDINIFCTYYVPANIVGEMSAFKA